MAAVAAQSLIAAEGIVAQRGATLGHVHGTAEGIEDPADNPEQAVQKKDRGAVLRRCLDQLTPGHREVLDLVYYHEKSMEEVAEILQIPEATVRTRMFYARKRLAELLKAEGVEHASA